VQIYTVTCMALARLSESDRKTIIWNFMEELLENYVNAVENNLQTKFTFMDFFYFGTLKDGYSEDDKISIIKQYANEKGYINITGDQVSVTKKGLKEFQKDTHNWDMKT
jgi:hypothetical protein